MLPLKKKVSLTKRMVSTMAPLVLEMAVYFAGNSTATQEMSSTSLPCSAARHSFTGTGEGKDEMEFTEAGPIQFDFGLPWQTRHP